MARFKTIQYAIDKETGEVISRCGDNVAIPVLQFADMKPENNFECTYKLESFPVLDVLPEMKNLLWTKKIPIEIKNEHRAFFEMPPLKAALQLI